MRCTRSAGWGVFLLLTACATSADPPTEMPAAPTGDSDAASVATDQTVDAPATPADSDGMRHGQRMRGQGQEGMRHGQGMHQDDGMRRGQGMGGMGQGQGMRHGQGTHQGDGMGRGQRMGGMGQGMGQGPDERLETLLADLPQELQEGQRLFDQICGVCHTLEPPPNLAPPMSHVARHLRESFDQEEALVDFVLEYVPEPDESRSQLPEMARQRFGLMPPLPLPEPLLEQVARYIWYLGS